jgi:hypothetical protein
VENDWNGSSVAAYSSDKGGMGSPGGWSAVVVPQTYSNDPAISFPALGVGLKGSSVATYSRSRGGGAKGKKSSSSSDVVEILEVGHEPSSSVSRYSSNNCGGGGGNGGPLFSSGPSAMICKKVFFSLVAHGVGLQIAG